MPWVFDPQSGGVRIPDRKKEEVRRRVLEYAERRYAGRYREIDVRFRGHLCYIDAYTEPDLAPGWPPADRHETREQMEERLRNTPLHLCRLRYFGDDRWSVAFYTYSHERYEPAIFPSGKWFGTPEEAFDIGTVYLRG